MSSNDDAKKEFLGGESWTNIPEVLSTFEKTEETLRMIKLHKYISELAEAIDPDLAPTSVWQKAQTEANNCHAQLDSNNATQAMAGMDSVLITIVPFVTNSKDTARAAGQAFGKYKNAVNDAFDELKQSREDLQQLNNNLRTSIAEVTKTTEKIEEYYSELFESDEEEGSKERQIEDLVEKIKNYHREIKKYHAELFGESEQTDDTGE